MKLRWVVLAAGLAVGAPAARAQGDADATAARGILTYTQALTPDAIRLIQGRLRDAGALQGAADGVWNSDSQSALRGFQQTRGLQVTGQMNQATAVTLGLNPLDLVGAGSGSPLAAPSPAPAAAPAPPPPQPSAAAPAAPAPAPVGARRAPVPLSALALRQVQIRLRENNYYTGPIDGAWGPSSQAALVRLQQSRGLPVTGRIDAASVQALGFDPDTFPPR